MAGLLLNPRPAEVQTRTQGGSNLTVSCYFPGPSLVQGPLPVHSIKTGIIENSKCGLMDKAHLGDTLGFVLDHRNTASA